VISGGGELALQAAKTCRERGAEHITVLYRENWQYSPVSDEDVKQLGLEDIHIIYDAAVCRLFGEDDRLTDLEYFQFDNFEKTTIPTQTLILAAGRFPELIFVKPKPAVSESEGSTEPVLEEAVENILQWQAILPYKQPIFKNEVGLFAEGDVLADYGAAIKAIGSGRRAAASIHQTIHGLEPSLSEKVITPESIIQNVDHVENVKATQRQIMPLCREPEPAACAEVERGFTQEMARAEAARCLQCGLICYQRSVEKAENIHSAANA
jgi:formate dehydrogenase beta subunit